MWKDVVGYEGLYEVSDEGLIKSSYKSKKILKPKKDKDGYLGVALTKDGKVKHYRIHRLVAEAFILNLENLPIVNHKDLDVKNNKVENLEWCTFVGNTKHYYANRDNKRTLSSLSKDELLSLVEKYHSGLSHTELANLFKLDCRKDAISEVVTGRRFSELTGILENTHTQRTTAKHSDDVILFMLHEYHNLRYSQKSLCEKYSLSPAQISRIVNGGRRKDLYDQFFQNKLESLFKENK